MTRCGPVPAGRCGQARFTAAAAVRLLAAGSRVVSADSILTHVAEVKVDHLSEDGGFFRTAHADSGASRGDSGIEASGDGHPSDCEGTRAVAWDSPAVFA